MEIGKIVEPLKGEVKLPPDKSVAIRASILKCLVPGIQIASSEGTSELLEQAGVTLENLDACLIKGSGTFECGNSATLARLLMGLLAGVDAEWLLTGGEQLSTRPMERVAGPLRLMGAKIEASDGGLPVTIKGGMLQGIEYEQPVASAQVKSAILFAAINARGTTIIHEAVPTRDHTERMLSALGVDIGTRVHRDGRSIEIDGPVKLHPADLFIPGDISSAIFLIALALLIPGSDVIIREVLLNPGRTEYLGCLASMGAAIDVEITNPQNFEPYGDIRVKGGGRLRNIGLDDFQMAGLIDEIPMLAFLGAFAEGTFSIHGVRELRYKESDRIKAICINLRAMGVEVEEYDDGFSFEGGDPSGRVDFKSYDDHRIALAAKVAGMVLGGCTLDNPDCSSASFPQFEDIVRSLLYRE